MPEQTWENSGEAPAAGPPVWFCRQCENHLRPPPDWQKTLDGRPPMPRMGKHFLANDNWGGKMPPALQKLRHGELMLLQWHRVLRRRQVLSSENYSRASERGPGQNQTSSLQKKEALRPGDDVPHLSSRRR